MTDAVFVSAGAAGAAVGDTVEVTGDEAHHAAVVTRVQVGERITVVDGDGYRVAGVVTAASPERVTVRAEVAGRDSDRPVVLVQALAKDRRDEQAVESATELGATRIIPWKASRSIAVWKGPKVERGREKWQSLALKAAKQSRRAFVPRVDELADTRDLARLIRGAVDEGARVVVLHEEATAHLSSLPWNIKPERALWLIVGPEGGISPEELDVLDDAGAVVALLGPHVLRASTAGPAAMAAIAALTGDWGPRE